MDTKYLIIIIVVIFLVVTSYLIFANQENIWTLSLYRDGITVLRLRYESVESCMSAGKSYIIDQSASRFDCGLNCEDSIDLTKGIICEKVCNVGGCR